MPRWTPDQEKAINLDKKNILVSAAAGSGKTAVLVERVVSHLLRNPRTEEDAWDVDRLMVVTFTKAAAAEMSQRISLQLQAKAAAEMAKEKPDMALINRLNRQNIMLSGAAITTIDSFCQKIVKNNFADIDLDPGFRIADENELQLLQQEVLDELIEAKYEAEDADLLMLADKYGSDKGDTALYDIIKKLYGKAVNQPFPEAWLQGLLRFFPEEGQEVKSLQDYGDWWQVVMSELKKGVAEARFYYRAFLKEKNQVDEKEFTKVFNRYEECLERADTLIKGAEEALDKGWNAIYAALKPLEETKTSFKGLLGGKVPRPDNAYAIKKINEAMRDALTSLKDNYVIDDEETMMEDFALLKQDAAALINLALDYGQAYSTAKREKNIADFNDIEHFALQILLSEEATPENPLPSATAMKLRQKYQEIMVDEYQDTNELQDTIVKLIAGDDLGNMFTVGDVKQSIYGFRASEPSLFIQKYETYGKAGDEEAPQQLITLSRNFRSRKEILSAVNFVFGQIMQKHTMEIEYDDGAMLNPGDPYGYTLPEGEEPKIMPLNQAVELDIINLESEEAEAKEKPQGKKPDSGKAGDEAESEEPEEELQRMEMEAQHIANRLKALQQEGYMVFDPGAPAGQQYRPVRWRDMVILLRSTKNKAEVIQEVLQANGIPVYANTADGYFQATEIQVMTSLLGIIDNAQQDVPLAAVLHSPIVGLDTADMAKLRLLAPKEDLYTALLLANGADSNLAPELKAKLADFLTKLSDWRRMAQRAGVPELLWQLYHDTGYYDYAGCMPGGVLRQANLRMLITRAQEFEATDYRGLFRFLGFIDKMKKMDTDLSMARTLGENENVVRVMTIHKSKGLEFPVVVIADMGKGFNLMDTRDNVLVHKSLGLGLKTVDLEKSISYPSFARLAVKAKMVAESKAEEQRVLYVAMTRAREKLIMVGTVKKMSDAATKWCRYITYQDEGNLDVTAEGQYRQVLPDFAVAGANSYLDWVAMAAARHSDTAKVLSQYGDKSEEEYRQALGHMAAVMGRSMTDDTGKKVSAPWRLNVIPASSLQLGSAEAAPDANELLDKLLQGEAMPASKEAEARIAAILNWQYDFQGTDKVPAKLSVSDLKRRFSGEAQQLETLEAVSALQEEKSYSFPKPVFVQRQEEQERAQQAEAAEASQKKKKSYAGAEYGTLMHNVMQHLELKDGLTARDIKAQLQVMTEREIITRDQQDIVNIYNIQRFLASDIGQRMLHAKKLWRELPFTRMLEADKYYPEACPGTRIFNQGVIDVLFEEANGDIIILDYKTDRNTDPEVIRDKYKIQLDLYTEAVESIIPAKVKERYLYMLRDGSIVKV